MGAPSLPHHATSPCLHVERFVAGTRLASIDAPPYGPSLLLSIRHPERPTSVLLCHPLSGHHQPSNPQPSRSPSWLPLVLVLSVVNQHAAARSLPPHALHLASP